MSGENSFPILSGRKKIIILTVVLLILIAVAVFLYRDKLNNKVFNSYSVTGSVKIDSQIVTNSKKFYGGVLLYSADGISFYKEGREVWNKAIDMSAPVIDTCGGYIAMAESKSNGIYIFDKNGNQYNIQSTYPVISVQVSKQGVVAATLDDGDANYIELSDKEGNKIASGRTVLAGDGYPLDISISEDGQKLVASYISVSNGTTQSKVVFYNFSAVGENEVDRIVGGFNQYKSTLVPDVEFINNSTVVAFGDNMFSIYSIDEKPKLVYEKEFDDKIRNVFYNADNIGIIFESQEASETGILKVYDKKGKVVMTKKLDFPYTEAYFAGENVVFSNGAECKMFSFKGKCRFDYVFDMNVRRILPLSYEKYILVAEEEISEITLK